MAICLSNYEAVNLTSTSRRLRSRAWLDDPDNADMTALYLERYLNFDLTLGELRTGRPIVGIAQSGSNLSPCNRHHLTLATRVRDGIRDAGGIPIEFPVHPNQETGKRPPRDSTAILPISAWSRSSMAI